jgi:transglutaminase-like putative cysteine protease
MKRSIFLLLINLIFLYFSISPIFAQTSPFDVTNKITYIVDTQSGMSVRHELSLTNLSADRYSTSYSVNVGNHRVRNPKAFESNGTTIPLKIETLTDDQTIITALFPSQVVGKGKIRQFTLTYDTPDHSQRIGNVLEIAIPKLIIPDSYQAYSVELVIPKELGLPAQITPHTYQNIEDPAYTKLLFTDESIKTKGISALFGDKQYYQLSLTYHLKNETVSPIETQIALPPDTSYQQIIITDISPPPLHVKPDNDGNWIATYGLEPKTAIDVTYKASVIVYANAKLKLPSSLSSPLPQHTTSQEYWPISHPTIKEIATDLLTPQSIYDYTVANLTYNYERTNSDTSDRLGALKALSDPQNALCLEFADTFITLARAKGIPTRLLTGYAYTENATVQPKSFVQDVLHAWPEYYLESLGTWVPIDPTWGHTTGGLDYFNRFDFNHIVFAIHGVSPDTPSPAGSYKIGPNPSQDVEVQLSTIIPEDIFDLTLEVNQPLLNYWRLTPAFNLHLKNHSNQALYNYQVTLLSNNSNEPPHQLIIDSALPYQNINVPINLSYRYDQKTQAYTIQSTHSTTQETLSFVPPYIIFLAFFAVTVFVFTPLAIVAARTRSLLVSKSRRSSALRRKS